MKSIYMKTMIMNMLMIKINLIEVNNMKIIDLLNKIANGEDVPKKIKITVIDDRITRYYNFFYDESDQEYKDDELFPIGARLILNRILNNKVEILEEEKKIPEKLPKSVTDNAGSSKDMRLIAITLNQMIDYLKSKEE